MVGDPKQTMEKLEALTRRYEGYGKYVEFLAATAREYGLWQKYGQQLADLYLRLKQGPVRLVIAGESSTGKSTLINAFAGEFIVPESAGVCTPVPVWLMRHNKKTTFVNPYQRRDDDLPAAQYAMSPSRLLELQYSAKADETFQNDKQILVYVDSPHLPPCVTLVDTPGLNANEADTAKTYALFDPPSYCSGDEADPPEIVLFLTRHENLMQSEVNALKDLFARGADRQSCFLVHNDVRDRTALFADTFEEVNRQAVAGLRSSLAALEAEEAPQEEQDCYSADLDFLDDDLAMEHVYSLNALLARLQCVKENEGIYPMAKYLPVGVTLEQREELLRQEDKQRAIAQVRDQWVAMGNSGYAPMQALSDGILEHVLWLCENSMELENVLIIADRLGRDILSECRPARSREGAEKIDALRQLLEELDAGPARSFATGEQARKTESTVLLLAKNAYDIHNKQLELVIQKATGKAINWTQLLTTLAGGAFFGPLGFLAGGMVQFIQNDKLWKEFKQLFDRYIGYNSFEAVFAEGKLKDPEPVLVVYSELLGKVDKILTSDPSLFREQFRQSLLSRVQQAEETLQSLKAVEERFATAMGTQKVRRMLTDGCSTDPEDVLDGLVRTLRRQIRQVDASCSGQEREKLIAGLEKHGAEVRASFAERKVLYQRVVCPVLAEKLEKYMATPDPEDEEKLKEQLHAYAAPIARLYETLRAEIANALAHRQAVYDEECRAECEAVQSELRRQADELRAQA